MGLKHSVFLLGHFKHTCRDELYSMLSIYLVWPRTQVNGLDLGVETEVYARIVNHLCIVYWWRQHVCIEYAVFERTYLGRRGVEIVFAWLNSPDLHLLLYIFRWRHWLWLICGNRPFCFFIFLYKSGHDKPYYFILFEYASGVRKSCCNTIEIK